MWHLVARFRWRHDFDAKVRLCSAVIDQSAKATIFVLISSVKTIFGPVTFEKEEETPLCDSLILKLGFSLQTFFPRQQFSAILSNKSVWKFRNCRADMDGDDDDDAGMKMELDCAYGSPVLCTTCAD